MCRRRSAAWPRATAPTSWWAWRASTKPSAFTTASAPGARCRWSSKRQIGRSATRASRTASGSTGWSSTPATGARRRADRPVGGGSPDQMRHAGAHRSGGRRRHRSVVAVVVERARAGVVRVAAGRGPAALGVERVTPALAVHEVARAVLEGGAGAAALPGAGACPLRHRLLAEGQDQHPDSELALLLERGGRPTRLDPLPDVACLGEHDLIRLR